MRVREVCLVSQCQQVTSHDATQITKFCLSLSSLFSMDLLLHGRDVGRMFERVRLVQGMGILSQRNKGVVNSMIQGKIFRRGRSVVFLKAKGKRQ